MSVKEQMIGILRSGEAHRINFTFRGSGGGDIRIGPSNFTLVAEVPANDRISGPWRADSRRTSIQRLRRHARGSAANTFYLGEPAVVALVQRPLPSTSRSTRRSTSRDHDSVDRQRGRGRTSRRATTCGTPGTRAIGWTSDRTRAWLPDGFNDHLGGDADYSALRDSLNASPQYHDYIRGRSRETDSAREGVRHTRAQYPGRGRGRVGDPHGRPAGTRREPRDHRHRRAHRPGRAAHPGPREARRRRREGRGVSRSWTLRPGWNGWAACSFGLFVGRRTFTLTPRLDGTSSVAPRG
jgi:hypothetical protein